MVPYLLARQTKGSLGWAEEGAGRPSRCCISREKLSCSTGSEVLMAPT